MFGHGPLLTRSLASLPKRLPLELQKSRDIASLAIHGIIIPELKTDEGLLIRSYGTVWLELVRQLRADWSVAHQLKPDQWEEMLAGAFKKAGYDEVTLTPRSKGMVTTTSDFPPLINQDPFIAPFLPTRLELLNGEKLQKWLAELSKA